MPDNSTMGSTTEIIATDEITTLNGATVSAVKAQRMKMGFGVDGSLTDVTSAAPLPIIDSDVELSLTTGMTTYRERVMAQRYAVLTDSIADGFSTIWTSTVSGGTTTVTGGEGLIQSGTTATGSAQLSSTAPVYLPGQSAWLLSAMRFGDTGSAGNIRRVGAFTVSGTTPQDGFYYELNDSTLNAVSVKGGTATAVASTAWSRVGLAPFTLDTNYHLFELRWTANRVDFYIDNVLRHTANGGATPITNTLNFPMTIQSISTAGTTSRVIAVRNIGLGRFGAPDTTVITGNAFVSLLNSSTAVLAANGVFTGPAEDVSEYSTIKVNVFASHASATDGVSLQQSSNGVNWDFVDNYTTLAAAGKTLGAPVQARYFRLVYTNGATANTAFRLQTIFGKNTRLAGSQRPQDGRTNENDLPEAMAFGMAYNNTSWDRVRSSAKAVQATSAIATQHMKDTGRVIFSAASAIAGVTAVTAEALLTMIAQRDGVAVATATTQAVTSGKRLRLTSISVGLISTGAAVLSGRISLRMTATGAVAAASPIVHTFAIPSGAALAQAGGALVLALPEGIELSGTMQFGLTHICNAATGLVWANVSGYEY